MIDDASRPTFTVGVYRTDCNNVLTGSPGSPEAWRFHKQRAQALHELFGKDAVWEVTNWGQTDDAASTHEYVALVVDLVTQPHFSAAATAALGFVGAALGSAVTDQIKEGVKYLIDKIWKKNKGGEKFKEVVISVDGGPLVRCVVGADSMEVSIQHDGKEHKVKYSPAA